MDRIDLPQIRVDDFSRRFALRAANLMWLLGAGASASAGIPTASDLIWDFKQRLFISQRRVSPKAVDDLSSPVIRAQLQSHIDSCGNLPPLGAPDEYAALFETTYSSEADRRTYLDSKTTGAKPSYGHLALATLMRAQLTRIVWTTNFDALVADACAKIYDATGALTSVALDAPDLAAQLINEGRWPIEVKLHGDFRSRRLKNTNDELRHQDVRLRRVLVDTCRRFGLVVAGYSGRDESVMDALEESLDIAGAFPAGLFWLHRGDGPPMPRVTQLLAHSVAKGVEAALVVVENFDETLRDLIRLLNAIDTKVLESYAAERRRWSGAPSPSGASGWPVVRLNAVPFLRTPVVCRRIECKVGGHIEARRAVEQVGVDVLVARTRAGVLAFGTDADVRSAFETFAISDFGLHTIESKRLRYESSERGLLRRALTRAFVRQRSLNAIHKRTRDLLAPAEPKSVIWKPLKRLVGNLSGSVGNHPELQWREGISVRIDWANDRLWLLIEPRTVFDGINATNRAAAADFARERAVKRYNRQLNELIAFWSSLLAGNGEELRAFGISDGVDAVFCLSCDTAFSRRSQP
jgi:hypothetical protein